MKNESSQTSDFLKEPAVTAKTTLSRTTLWRLISEGRFPPAVKISNKAVAWRRTDIEQWAENPEGWAENHTA